MKRSNSALSVALVTVASVSLAGCETVLTETHPLDGTGWALVEVDRDGVSSKLRPRLSERHTISFSSDGGMLAQLDCNRGSAKWSASMPTIAERGERGTIEIGNIAATRALCPSPSFGEQMAAGLSGVANYRLTQNRSRLVIRLRGTRFIFRAN
uniref:META domain-containing protein n=1 Tax=uncultured Altererythrobacter sp. TaxID=500840 RepID=UPI003434190C